MTRTSSWIPSPSFYAFLLPNHHRSSVDALAATGQFPALDGLFSSCGYMLLFGMLRMICTYLVMKPLAIQCLKITYNDNKRHNIACDKKITKFVEAMWRFLLYTYFCYLGYQALFVPKPVSWIVDREGNWGNPEEHWRGWPVQSISTAILFYYNIQLGCYLHQLSWTEVSRSDALEMILHHIVTIFLILFSYLTNFTRIGASILLLHDSADIFLESAKIFNYISKTEGQKKVGIICDTLFAIFAIVFLITRLILFPRYCVYSLVFHAPMMLGGTWPGYWIFASLLVSRVSNKQVHTNKNILIFPLTHPLIHLQMHAFSNTPSNPSLGYIAMFAYILVLSYHAHGSGLGEQWSGGKRCTRV